MSPEIGIDVDLKDNLLQEEKADAVELAESRSMIYPSWQGYSTPPGSVNEDGACIQMGNLGTWESHYFPCNNYRRKGSPVEQTSKA